MSWTQKRLSTRSVSFLATILALAVVAFYVSRLSEPVSASSDSSAAVISLGGTTFPADAPSLGAIPDGGPGCGVPAATNRDVTFTVSGIPGPPSDVEVSLTFGGPTHSWGGDITARLIAPNGTSHVLFGNRGSTTAGGCGSSNDLAGPYVFFDTAALTNFFTALGNPTTAGSYRTTTVGGTPTSGAVTSMNPVFTGIPTSNGTWILRVNDQGGGDTGAVSAASLTLTAGVVPGGPAPLDYDGDGRTDFVVVRNVGGGPTGQVRWFVNEADGAPTVAFDWGIATDFFVSADFDGDNKSDYAIWRPGAAQVAAYYIHNSSNNTVRVETFGQTGDDPTVVGDYDGDGMADLSVYRPGPTAGAQSTWFYKASAANPGGNITFIPWGQNGDFPAPGDFDGDGKYDFTIQRGPSPATFWTRQSSNGATVTNVFGNATDVIVPGDYDGDGRTDIAVVRAIGGVINWFVRRSSDSVIVQVGWGVSATDFVAQGDYTGDGRTDFAVWRGGQFWVLDSSSFAVTTNQLGAGGDYPVANFNSH